MHGGFTGKTPIRMECTAMWDNTHFKIQSDGMRISNNDRRLDISMPPDQAAIIHIPGTSTSRLANVEILVKLANIEEVAALRKVRAEYDRLAGLSGNKLFPRCKAFFLIDLLE